MTQQEQHRPRRILLATDLGARSDRALDRAVLLATHWGAELLAVHALESVDTRFSGMPERDLPSWRRGPEPLQMAKDSLARDLHGAQMPITALVEEGDPASVILRAAEAHGCDLIVTGVARDEVLGRFLLGTTVDTLLRNTGVPVLVVRQRARRPYGSIVVAADTSDASRAALDKTVELFPELGFRVFHAYQPPLGGMLSDPTDYRAAFGRMAKQELVDFVAAFAAQKGLPRGRVLDVLVERGDPAVLIRQYLHAFHADLVVLGTRGRGAVMEFLVGSTAKAMLGGIDCDALLVPEAAAAA